MSRILYSACLYDTLSAMRSKNCGKKAYKLSRISIMNETPHIAGRKYYVLRA